MYLAGRLDVREVWQSHDMTSYGGYGVSMTPQFSVFVAFLMEHGCLFALPNIRGGSEFGVAWHEAANAATVRPLTMISFRGRMAHQTGRTAPESSRSSAARIPVYS